MSFEQLFDLFKVIISATISSTIASIIAPILLSHLWKKTGQPEEKIALPPKEKERRDEEKKRKRRKIQTITFVVVFFVFILSAAVYSSDRFTKLQKVNLENNAATSTTPTNNAVTNNLVECTKNLSIYKGANVFVSSNSNNNINVRKVPGTQSPIVTTLPNGTLLLVLSDAICIDNIEWWEITNHNGNIKGWVAGHLIKLDENK